MLEKSLTHVLQLLRPEFANLLTKDQENDVFELIGRLIQTLSSPEIAIDDRHTPKLYARFLAGLLSKHRRDGATVGRLHPHPPPHNPIPAPQSNEYSTPSELSHQTFSISQPLGGVPHNHLQEPQGGYSHVAFNQPGEFEAAGTPIYRPEATYALGAGPISFGDNGDIDLLGFGAGNGVSDEEMLATMHALKNPAWWQNMMMPGYASLFVFCFAWFSDASLSLSSFSWPDAHSPVPSPPAGAGAYQQNMNNTGFNTGFGVFHDPQVPLR